MNSNQVIIFFLKSRRPGHWNVDSLRQLDNTDLIVSPGCNSSRNGSSGFSSGEASTNSSATTPPPSMTSSNIYQHDSTSILDEPELRNAPWFQKGIPRYFYLINVDIVQNM